MKYKPCLKLKKSRIINIIENIRKKLVNNLTEDKNQYIALLYVQARYKTRTQKSQEKCTQFKKINK